jgi:exodeoxyribonuclease VII small subunit
VCTGERAKPADDAASECGQSSKAAGRPIFVRHASDDPHGGPMNPVPPKAAGQARKGDFEKSLTRLEEVVKLLEIPELSLDEAMKLFEEGVKLSRDCQKHLEEAEGRVEILLKKADGKIAAEPFEPEDESS